MCNATRAPVGESRIEVSNNAREYTSSGVRVRLVSVRIVDVQPWSGPVGGATVVSVRSYGVWPGGVRCRFGDSSLSVGWSGGASRLRCLTPPSGGDASGWVGVQLSSFHGALSSGGSFYYHASLTASATAPSLGPERGGTRVSLLGGGFRDAYTLRCAFGSVCACARSLRRRVAARVLVAGARAWYRGCALIDERPAVRARSGVSYTYQPAASVSYISPCDGAYLRAARHVTVHGAGFSSASESLGVLTCRIGGTVRRAVWASSLRSCATRLGRRLARLASR